jgi:hypothetical protein
VYVCGIEKEKKKEGTDLLLVARERSYNVAEHKMSYERDEHYLIKNI